MSLQAIKAGYRIGTNWTEWPDRMTAKQAGLLQSWKAGRDARLFYPGDKDFLRPCERLSIVESLAVQPRVNPEWTQWQKEAKDFERWIKPASKEEHHNITAPALAAFMKAHGESPSELISAWFKHQGVACTAPEPAQDAAPPEAVAAESWHLKKPKRERGYNFALHQVLKAAQVEGKPCPKARDVLDSWKAMNLREITEVMSDGFKYTDSQGNTEEADLKLSAPIQI